MSKKPITSDHCRCGSQLPLGQCCGPLLEGTKAAETAEQLMRSRYTAYALGDWQYLYKSWHSTTRPASHELQATEPAQWLALRVLQCEAGTVSDDSGTVEFIATCKINGRAHKLHETSEFIREAGAWVYVDGEQHQQHAQPAAGDLCQCGSGRRFRQCCGRRRL